MTAHLDALARRVAADLCFLACCLGADQQAHGLADAALALHLGCPSEALSRLRLCAVPRPEDLHRVAVYCGCDPDRLGEVLAYEGKP